MSESSEHILSVASAQHSDDRGVLFVNLFFFPDAAATSQLLTDLVRSSSLNAATTTVITGAPSYATRSNDAEAPQVTIRRVSSTSFSRRPFSRLACYFTFFLSAAWAAIRIRRAPCVIVTLTTPPFISLIGTFLKYTRGVRHVVWEMDVYPDVGAVASIHGPLRLLTTLGSRLARFIHRHADAIIVLGECMKDRLVTNGAPADRIQVAPNWADGETITPRPFPKSGPLRVLYSGNLGLAHDTETVSSVILRVRNDPRFSFTFAGGGARYIQLKEWARTHRLTNVTFDAYCKLSDLGASLAAGDIGLVTMNPLALGAIVPSKVYGIMAAGRPLLFIGPSEAEPSLVIDRYRCGWRVQPGDVQGLFELLNRLDKERDEVYEYGSRARTAFEAMYDRKKGIARVVDIIRRVSRDGEC